MPGKLMQFWEEKYLEENEASEYLSEKQENEDVYCTIKSKAE